MLKQTILAAFAVAACSAFAQNGMMMDVDAKSSKPADLMKFLNMDAYKKLSAPDAYILTQFVGEIPGNYQTAVLRGLVMNAQEAWTAKERNQTAANSMAPMGMDGGKMTWWKPMEGDPMPPRSYWDTIATLQRGQDATDQGLIQSLFELKSFTVDPLMSPWHERQLDAISKYLKANAWSAEPVRLKYTSLAPHMYAGLPSNWSSLPWPSGS